VSRTGFTLIESIVVLVVLSVVLSTVALGFPSTDRDAPAGSRVEVLHRARVRALISGRPVTAGGPVRPVLFLPDGRAIGLGVDPLTGTPDDSAH
jgi:prepilin-type N-terminal cleavage/methylation domain-containing protein